MRIFYGVQGTGNGHITRARMMARELYKVGAEIDFLFTGRDASQYFEMGIFQHYQVKQGLTFTFQEGQVQYLKTAFNNKPRQFFKDIAAMDFAGYDLIISDFEPVTSWAARKHKHKGKVLGIGHQYAFDYAIPIAKADPIAKRIMKYFAPVDIGIGLHWHHFGQPILPPIIETPEQLPAINKNKIVVYLPFEERDDIIKLLAPFSEFVFHIYATDHSPCAFEHLQFQPISREAFQQDFYDCAGIISNAGFELASESLQAGKKVLAKPLHAQMEQISNALALKQLGFGQTMYDLDMKVVEAWLYTPRAVRVTYPNVAQLVVQWIMQGMPPLQDDFIASVWGQVNVLQIQQ